MLSKEEIEKILDQNESIITYKADKDFRNLTSSERTLLENNSKIKKYIDQLEKSDISKEQSSINYYNKCKKLEQEVKKQSKIINEMAMEIASYDNDETFCKEVYPNNSCEGNGIPCWDCVKLYFEKKVEGKLND